MADLNPTAKRIHNLTPTPVRLTLDDGTEAVFEMAWTEFFQQEFQAEATRQDDGAVAEPVVYMIDHFVVGGFYLQRARRIGNGGPGAQKEAGDDQTDDGRLTHRASPPEGPSHRWWRPRGPGATTVTGG